MTSSDKSVPYNEKSSRHHISVKDTMEKIGRNVFHPNSYSVVNLCYITRSPVKSYIYQGKASFRVIFLTTNPRLKQYIMKNQLNYKKCSYNIN